MLELSLEVLLEAEVLAEAEVQVEAVLVGYLPELLAGRDEGAVFLAGLALQAQSGVRVVGLK